MFELIQKIIARHFQYSHCEEKAEGITFHGVKFRQSCWDFNAGAEIPRLTIQALDKFPCVKILFWRYEDQQLLVYRNLDLCVTLT